MTKHLKIILDEMARRVGLKSIDEVDIKNPKWYMLHKWTEKEMYAFRDWLTNYMLDREARKELMRGYSSYNARKKQREKLANEFIFQYGWKTKL